MKATAWRAEALTTAGTLTGITGGALLALGVVLAFMGWRLRRAALLAVGAAVQLAAGMTLAWSGLAVWSGLLGLLALAFTLWLIHRALEALSAGRQQHQALRQTLLARDAQLDQAQAQLQQAQAQAEAADQAKARFLAAASHDLRQPAHALGLYTAALRAGPLEPQQAELAERMQGSLAALDLLFAALLDVSRMDSGTVVPQWDTVALAPLLRRLADEWAPLAEAGGLRLALHVSNPQAQTVTDPVLLERVLRNLLANAVKYTAKGGVLLACRQRTDAEGRQHHRIEVWDSGLGITPADQERVFEEFYQSTGVAPVAGPEQPRGLGLGLAIVQRLARLLQLNVRLGSRPGRGSVFWVEGLAPAGQAPLLAAAARLQMRRLAGLLVVVLEADPELRDAMRRLLQLWDCRVVDGHSASDLLQRLTAAPDAVIASLRLGLQRTGPQEVQQLQQAWGQDVPVLWIEGEPASRAQFHLPSGPALVLSKPVSPARLRAWLEQCVPSADDARSTARTAPPQAP